MEPRKKRHKWANSAVKNRGYDSWFLFSSSHAHEANAYFPLGRSPKPFFLFFFFWFFLPKKTKTKAFFGGLQPPTPRFAKR
jgi:hypothetical protein